MMDAHEIEQFFAEQGAIMSMPDGDIDSHIATILAASRSEPRREDGLPNDIVKLPSGGVESVPQHELAFQSKPTSGRKRLPSDDIESRSKRPRTSPAPQKQSKAHIPEGFKCALQLNIEPIPNYDAKAQAPQDATCREDTFASESPAPFDVTEDISVFTEPTVGFTKLQSPQHRIGNKRPARQEPQVQANGKNGTKKALQFVQLQGGGVSSKLGAAALSSSPIEEPTPLPSNAKPKPRTASPDSLLKGVERQMSAHATANKRTKVVKLADRAKKTPEAGPSSLADLSSSSRNADTVDCADPAAGPSKGKKVPAKAPAKVAKSVTKTKDKNKKAPKCTPYEYALSLQEKMLLRAEKPKEHKFQFLKGKVFFYIGSDMIYASQSTRGRMDYIVRHGGTLLPAYDPARLTHIVTDTVKASTLRALGVKSLREVPKRIPIVTWNWVSAGLGRKRRANNQSRDESEIEIDDVFEHAAFNSEVSFYAETYGRGKQPTRVPKGDTVIDLNEIEGECVENRSSRNSSFTPTIPKGSKPQTSGDSSPSPRLSDLEASTEPGSLRLKKEDPFAKFYEQAQAELEGESSAPSGTEDNDESDPGTDDEDFKPSHPPIKRGFACDRKEPQLITSPNQDVVDKLQELMDLHKAKPGVEDRWRAFSYGKCTPLLSCANAQRLMGFVSRSIRGVGEKTARKVDVFIVVMNSKVDNIWQIMEILETGDLKRIGYERTEDVEVCCLFQGVYGVGQSTAQKWYANGCRTLEDLKNGKSGVKLSPAQEIGLKFYDDINARMPRDEAKALFDLIKPIALSIDPDLFVDIMGSYRRGKSTCGDIDILITRNPADGKTHAGVLPTLLLKLHEIGIITEDLAIPEGDDEENVYRGLCRLPEPGSRRRRIDFLTVPWTSRGAALLYYTGDDIFNRAMRYKANVMGYSLNQRGLYSGVVRDPQDRRIKTNKGSLIASETEQEIFKILGVPWQEPHERSDIVLSALWTIGYSTFFAPGLGACGAVSQPTDLIVALSPAQFAGGANCFRHIGINYGGKFIDATVVDLCPGCAGDSIDLSPSAFQALENPDVGRIQVNWNFE
ncbi:hypothetical protein CCMSSC00406_0005174 [Pleurotus cornucopiae]|uniref:Uncharacterized protein n=1 Tax=Pleurotus cornucopiae TaxID=5321 RepID=A0ACB7IJ70_PLECO|nr:hypothetical protein CCMSSC00406_0005174 [Pleurotus cornucopiae]